MRTALKKPLRRAMWIAGGLWAYSWWVIYLEIHRWHHMTPTFALNPPAAPPGFPPPRPGMFLMSARFLAVAAPVAFAALIVVRLFTGRVSRASANRDSDI